MKKKRNERILYILQALTNLIVTRETEDSKNAEIRKVFTFFMREKRKYTLTGIEIEEINSKIMKLQELGIAEFNVILNEAFKVDKKLKNIFIGIDIIENPNGFEILSVI